MKKQQISQEESPFAQMQKVGKKIALYSSVLQVLEWDQETYMPPESIQVRSEQIELMAGLIHKESTSSSFKKSLGKLCNLDSGLPLDIKLSEEEKTAVKLWHKEWKQASKLPSSFVRLCSKTSSEAVHAWTLAKKNSDFALFLPHLEKTIALCQKKTKLLGYKEHPYDALLDLFEPDMTVSRLVPLFDKLKSSLKELLQKIQRQPKKKHLPLPLFDPDLQMQLGKTLLRTLGFSEDISRLDLSSHPFCVGIHPTDTRMTTRVFKDNLISNIMSILHESGHGLYNMQLPKNYYGTPLCQPLSYGVDESQSRLWETLIGKGQPFWKFFYPILQNTFPKQLKDYPLSQFYDLINVVEPSCIRVEADEVTYCLHIILRFEIEKRLIEGSLKAQDIPFVWNEKMQEYLGISPKNDQEGCLQDIHWAMGGFGYFSTYAFGNLLAAQIYKTLEETIPLLDLEIEKGNFTPVRNFLKEQIHQYGRIYPTEELIKKVTGQPLSPTFYIKYLEKKYI